MQAEIRTKAFLSGTAFPTRLPSKKTPGFITFYDYNGDGTVKRVSTVSTKGAANSEYGPEKFVVEFFYDDVGRMVRKIVSDYTGQAASRYETDFEFDGRGQLTRERILKWDKDKERMNVLQDVRTTYDLGGKAKEIKFYDQSGWAYTETRAYARGYQLTGATFQAAAGVTVTTSGSYTYNTNNNLTGTKKVSMFRETLVPKLR